MKRPRYSIREVWGPLRSVLGDFAFSGIKRIAGTAGIDMTALSHLTQEIPRPSSKESLLTAIDREFGQMESEKQEQFVRIVIEEMLCRTDELQDKISDDLRRLGWSFSKGKLLPLSLIDDLDLSIIPPESLGDLMKAAQRLRDGDFTGALTSAAGVVDSACAEIYAWKGLGNPEHATFQEKVGKCLAACNSFDTIKQELVSLSWDEQEAKRLVDNLRGSLNQATYVIQKLRSQMGDVHGRKDVYQPLVYDSIKWASIIVSLFPKPRVGEKLHPTMELF